MLRELNENEMEMVSGGSIDWEPTPAGPGTEVWGFWGDLGSLISSMASAMAFGMIIAQKDNFKMRLMICRNLIRLATV